jgi:hypothetical protein
MVKYGDKVRLYAAVKGVKGVLPYRKIKRTHGWSSSVHAFFHLKPVKSINKPSHPISQLV